MQRRRILAGVVVLSFGRVGCGLGLPQGSRGNGRGQNSAREASLRVPLGEAAALGPVGDGDAEDAAATLLADVWAEQTAAEANVPFDTVKNLRDLAGVEPKRIKPRRFFRMGYPSKASEADLRKLREDIGLRTLVDLRSDKELFMDELVDSGPYYADFESFRRCRSTRRWYTFSMSTVPDQPMHQQEALGKKAVKKVAKRVKSKMHSGLLKRTVKPVPVEDPTVGPAPGPQRLLISVMDEATYKRGVLSRVRKRHKAAIMVLLVGGVFSKRAYERARQYVLDYVNEGGLPLLNDLLLSYSGQELAMILRLAADRSRHPIGLYCTAGKDRTGLVVMLILSAIGVKDEALLNDYVLSDNAYKDLNDNKAMVGALEQQNLNAETFLRAPRHVMEATLLHVRENYGSVHNYLDHIGFDATWRAKLKHALMDD